MKNKLFIVLIAIVIVFAGRTVVYGFGGCGCKKNRGAYKNGTEISAIIEVGNKTCPVLGKEIIKSEAVMIEHEGKIYNLCCADCVGEFRNDPNKYVEKIEELLIEQPNGEYCSDSQSCSG